MLPTALPLVCSISTSAGLLTSQHQSLAATTGTSTDSSPEQHWSCDFVGRNWTSYTSTETWQHRAPKLWSTCGFTRVKAKGQKEQGSSSKPHLAATWRDQPGEGTLKHTHIRMQMGSSSQFHLVKLPLGNSDPRNDTVDYLGLLCDLYSTQNLYASTQRRV